MHVVPNTRQQASIIPSGKRAVGTFFGITWTSSAITKHALVVITPFKVADVSTNKKPVSSFLLANNTSLHPVRHKFSTYRTVFVKLLPLTRECLYSSMHSFLITSASIAINYILLKTRFFELYHIHRYGPWLLLWLWVIFKHFDVNWPSKLLNLAE